MKTLNINNGKSSAAINTQAGNYTAVLADDDRVITSNSAVAVNITIPPNSAVLFAVNAELKLRQLGVGISTFVAGSGVTIQKSANVIAMAQYGFQHATQVSPNTWVVW